VTDWRVAAAAPKKDHGLVVKLARQHDFATLCEAATGDELMNLVDSQRYSGHEEEALRTLGCVRRRFPASEHAEVALFTQGRVAASKGRYEDAISAFETFLEIYPINDDPERVESAERQFRQQSVLGRLATELYPKTGRDPRPLAKRYLLHFPDGLYARRAQGLLAQ